MQEFATDILGKVFTEYGLAMLVLVVVSGFLGWRLWKQGNFIQTTLLHIIESSITQNQETTKAVDLLRERIR